MNHESQFHLSNMSLIRDWSKLLSVECFFVDWNMRTFVGYEQSMNTMLAVASLSIPSTGCGCVMLSVLRTEYFNSCCWSICVFFFFFHLCAIAQKAHILWCSVLYNVQRSAARQLSNSYECVSTNNNNTFIIFLRFPIDSDSPNADHMQQYKVIACTRQTPTFVCDCSLRQALHSATLYNAYSVRVYSFHDHTSEQCARQMMPSGCMSASKTAECKLAVRWMSVVYERAAQSKGKHRTHTQVGCAR